METVVFITSIATTLFTGIFILILRRFLSSVDKLQKNVETLIISNATNQVLCNSRHDRINERLTGHDKDIKSLKTITDKHDRILDKQNQ